MNERIELLTSRQAGEILGIHVRTVQRLTKQGKIRGIRIGKLFKYKRQDIEEYLLLGTDFSKEPIRRPGDFIERRAYPRINTNLRCSFSINLPPFKTIDSTGIVKNLSVGGVLVVCCENGVEIGDLVNLEFMGVETSGRIVRMDRNEFAIRFRDIKEEYKKRIEEYVG